MPYNLQAEAVSLSNAGLIIVWQTGCYSLTRIPIWNSIPFTNSQNSFDKTSYRSDHNYPFTRKFF